MYTITGKKNGIIWDEAANKPLARFKDGAFETEDEAAARKLQAKGYAVEGLPPAAPAMPEHLAGKSAEELKAYAAEKNIDIGNASSASGIIKKIMEAEKPAQ